MKEIQIIDKKERYICHPQVDLQFDDGRKIQCDKQISLLIKELNDFGFETKYSCQGSFDKRNGEVAYVLLANPRRLNLKIADTLIRNFWKNAYMIETHEFKTTKLKNFYAWYAFTKEQYFFYKNLIKKKLK